MMERIPRGMAVMRGGTGIYCAADSRLGQIIGTSVDILEKGDMARYNGKGRVEKDSRLSFIHEEGIVYTTPEGLPELLKKLRQKRFELGLESSDPVPTNPETCHNLDGDAFLRVGDVGGRLYIEENNTYDDGRRPMVLDERTETFLWHVLRERRKARGQ